MIFSRSWLLAMAALAPAAGLVQPAHASARADGRLALRSAPKAEATAAPAPSAHHGLAFAARTGAKARLVEPDGRVVVIDGSSDLVAPASIASHEAKDAIAKLIQVAAPASSPLRRFAQSQP